jgi:hypothetical protein
MRLTKRRDGDATAVAPAQSPSVPPPPPAPAAAYDVPPPPAPAAALPPPDFNNINKFGYTFINGGTNGPTGTGDTQFYRWHIGLGSDHPTITGTGSYGMQFAIGRTATNPRLSMKMEVGVRGKF